MGDEDEEPEEDTLEIDELVIRVDKERGIVTTEEEIEGLFAVKSILRDLIDAKRIHMRDTKSYCGILLDNNNRKPVCRLHFNQEQKYLGLFNEKKKEDRVPIDDIDDIYRYATRIISTVKRYDGILSQEETTDEQGTIQGRNAKYTGKKVIAVHFKGNRYVVGSWKDSMFAILIALRTEDSTNFEKVAPTMVGRVRPYITTDESLLRSAENIPNTPFFIETNLGANGITKLCFDLAEKMGIDESEIAFETD